MDTSRVDGVKASLHNGTPRSRHNFLAIFRGTGPDPLQVAHVAVRLLGQGQTLRIDAEPPRAERLDRRRERDVQGRAPVRKTASKSEKRPPIFIIPGDDAFE